MHRQQQPDSHGGPTPRSLRSGSRVAVLSSQLTSHGVKRCGLTKERGQGNWPEGRLVPTLQPPSSSQHSPGRLKKGLGPGHESGLGCPEPQGQQRVLEAPSVEGKYGFWRKAPDARIFSLLTPIVIALTLRQSLRAWGNHKSEALGRGK